MENDKLRDLTFVPDDYIVMNHKTDRAKRLNDKHVVYEIQTEIVPLIKCKDCKHYESDGGCLMVCGVTKMVVGDEDYCSYGQKEG